MLDFRDFSGLFNWIRERARTAGGRGPTADEAPSLAVIISDAPLRDDVGTWYAALQGQMWTIPPPPSNSGEGEKWPPAPQC